MATNDKTGPSDEAVEGSWSPKRTPTTSEKKADKNGSAATPDPEALAGEIEKTREDLAETLDAIADKVSPKRVVGRKKQAAKEGASDAADSVKATASDAAETVKETAASASETVKETAASASEAVKSGVAKAEDKVSGEPAQPAVPVAVAEVPVEVAPTPGALADTAAMPVVPVGAEEPVYTSTLPPPAASRAPIFAGAGAATLVTLFLLRRRRRRRR